MFNKLKVKASQPLTYGWLWKCYIGEIVAVGIIYGGMWLYGAYLERKANEAAQRHNIGADGITVDYDKFDED